MSKIHLPIAELKPALMGLSKIISRRSTLPVLACVKLERTKDGWIVLTGTDLEVFVSVRLEQPAEGAADSIVVSHEHLARITKTCATTDAITLEQANKEKVAIHYPIGGHVATHQLDAIAVDDFPVIPKINAEAVPLPESVRASIHAAFECCSDDETRQVLNGAYLDVSDAKSGHHVVATDGRHLYSANSFTLPLSQSVIIPDHAFLSWKEFSRDGEWRMKIGKEEKDQPAFIQISSRRWRFIHRAIEGNYPNWRQVCINSAQIKTVVELPEEDLDAIAQLISRLPEAINDPNHAVGLKMVDKRIFVVGRNALDQPWMEVEINGAKVVGPDIHIYLNRQYVVKALKLGLNKIEFQEPLSPLRFSKEGQQITIMPVRVDVPPAGNTAPERPPAPVKQVSETSTIERSNPIMPKPAATPVAVVTNSNGTNGHHPVEAKPSVEVALDKIEIIKGSYREAIHGLNDLADLLKQVQREHKSTHKEVQSVRMTLEKLQTVRI